MQSTNSYNNSYSQTRSGNNISTPQQQRPASKPITYPGTPDFIDDYDQNELHNNTTLNTTTQNVNETLSDYVQATSPTGAEEDWKDNREDKPFTVIRRIKSIAPEIHVLKLHNLARNNLGIPNLYLDADLSYKAQKWARHLYEIKALVHENLKGIGENLARITTRDPIRMEDALDRLFQLWMDEGDNFTNKKWPNCKLHSKGEEVGHYTQVLWRETRVLGVGYYTDTKYHFLVCYYTPTGNVKGKVTY